MSTTTKPPKREPRPKLVDHDKGVEAIVAANEWNDTPRNRERAENELAQVRLRSIGQEIEAKAADIMADVLSFAQVKPGQATPTQEMIDAYGETVAYEKFRRMQAGVLPAKDCPVALRVAMNIHTAAMRIRGEQQTPRLHVQVANMVIKEVSFPTLQVTK
jgi:hypothetical protein